MKREIHITIFCDESKERKIKETQVSESENWTYIGICIVPTDKIKKVSSILNSLRCGANEDYLTCTKKCKFHNDNKRKIHYNNLQNNLVYKTSKKWTKYILENYINKDFYINILGINYCKLDKNKFKSNDNKTSTKENIYCRFFRTAILSGIKYLLSDYDTIIVDNIYHDIGEMKYHEYFKNQVIKYIKWNEERIIMNCQEIKFLKTDNENCMDAENVFLQLIDLFLGETINLIHNDAETENKIKLSLEIYPIIDHCLNNPYNVNNNYFKLYSISFFPKYKICSDMDNIDLELKRKNNFYTKREIKTSDKCEQLSLF